MQFELKTNLTNFAWQGTDSWAICEKIKLINIQIQKHLSPAESTSHFLLPVLCTIELEGCINF